jgi:pantoate--beta-alanine ligase
MIQFKKINTLQTYLNQQRINGKKIGFVPTMGALHAGHLSLLEAARNACDLLVCSIFVNPTQFNDPKDYEKYPITLDTDIQLLASANTDILFLPAVTELYPEGTSSLEKYPLGFLEQILEGEFRPGHFQGVCQVMKRLLDAVEPDKLFMGQKDYQQCMVVQRLLDILGKEIELIPCPTIREPDGLAMSSRNRRLSAEGREKAIGIFSTLEYVKANLKKGPQESLLKEAHTLLERAGFRIEYITLANAKSLEIRNEWDGSSKLVCLIAAFLDGVRLIDNMVVSK